MKTYSDFEYQFFKTFKNYGIIEINVYKKTVIIAHLILTIF